MEILGFEIPLIPTICVAFVLWRFIKHAFFGFDYFEKQGIPTAQPVYPLVGSLWGIWKDDQRAKDMKNVKKYGKLFGTFYGKSAMFVVSDPDMIKAITVKDAENFIDRPEFAPDNQKYVRKMVSNLRGQEWKDVRSAISPVFSSGKIKRMSVLMQDCCKSLVEVALKRAKQGNGLVDVKELYGVYTLDIIASCAFGTKINDLDDPNSPFIAKSRRAFTPDLMENPLIVLPFMYRWILRFGLDFIPRDVNEFYAKVVQDIMKRRSMETKRRGDVLDILLEVHEAEQAALKQDPTEKPIVTEEVIIAQCVIFFLAGFDTTGTLLTCVTYHLALNPECQEKLHREVEAVLKRHEGNINHESVAECIYLDQCLEEALRLSPPVIQAQRECTHSCEVKGVRFNKGDYVTFPVYAMHHSEEYFPDPEKFDPERFAPENKGKIKPLTFMPFGNGPRNCIGMRFAYEEAKLALATMVSKFKFLQTSETTVPFKTLHNVFMLNPKDVKVKLELR